MNQCEYGCGQEEKFKLKNGKSCCCSSANSCSAMRAKNTLGLKDSYSKGERTSIFNEEHRNKSIASKRKKAKDSFLTKNSYNSNNAIKNILFKGLNWENKCSQCNITEWCEQKLNMQLDHIDGNNSNNQIENLRLLCPNCHSLTPTYCGKSINTGKKRISDDILIEAIKNSSNVRQALIAVGLTPKGANYTRAYKLLSALKET
jgi:hypothetical protein